MFQSNYSKNTGYKKEQEINLMKIGAAKMIGDFECLAGQAAYEMSVFCTSKTGAYYRIKKQDFSKILNEDAKKMVLKVSKEQFS